MHFIDFAALKERVTIEEAAQMLGLQLKTSGQQLRGPCPTCNAGGDRAIVITPSKQLFYCFSAKVGGDLIKLISHIENVDVLEAAIRIDRHISGHSN